MNAEEVQAAREQVRAARVKHHVGAGLGPCSLVYLAPSPQHGTWQGQTAERQRATCIRLDRFIREWRLEQDYRP